MNCPKCDSPAPHLHPSIQFEGETQSCDHEFHRQITSQNTVIRLVEFALNELETGNLDLCRAVLRSLIGEKA